MLERSNQIPNWFLLASAIRIQFDPSQFDNPRVDLLKFTQNNFVSVYYDTFIELTNQVVDMDDSVLMDCFVGGLISQLRKEVITQIPQSLNCLRKKLFQFFHHLAHVTYTCPRNHPITLYPHKPKVKRNCSYLPLLLFCLTAETHSP